MKAPDFWEERGFKAELLLPFSVLYYIFYRIREFFSSPKKINIPVICIGNATAGGAGKTPTAIAIANILKNKKVAFVSRGYKGKLKDPVKVDINKHTANDVGDEPLLLAKISTCWVSKNRLAGAIAAEKDGAEIIILDDGLQNLSVKKDLSILVVDGGYGFGNYLLIPSGPLRNKLQNTIEKCTFSIIIGDDDKNVSEKLSSIPLINAKILPTGKKTYEGKNLVAFAGIGRPEKFFDTIRENGLKTVRTFSFPDHHQYDERDLQEACEIAEKEKADLITTEKDYVRLPENIKKKTISFPIKIEWEDESKIRNLLKDYI